MYHSFLVSLHAELVWITINTTMDAVLQEPITQVGTISEEKWNSLHTLEELDTALNTIIYKHFHA